MALKPSSASLQDASELAALWEGAVVEYTKHTGKNLCKARFRSMDDVMRDSRQKLEAFEAYRHPNTKTDKVRSAFSRNLETIEKVLSGVHMVGSGAGAVRIHCTIFKSWGLISLIVSRYSRQKCRRLYFFLPLATFFR